MLDHRDNSFSSPLSKSPLSYLGLVQVIEDGHKYSILPSGLMQHSGFVCLFQKVCLGCCSWLPCVLSCYEGCHALVDGWCLMHASCKTLKIIGQSFLILALVQLHSYSLALIELCYKRRV